jgi:UDP-glucuronate decarboxylase
MPNVVVRDDLHYITNDKSIAWEDLRGKTFLISGASGFLPAYMVETLLFLNETRDLNIKIVALVRNKERAYKRFADYQNRTDLKFVVQNVCDSINIEDSVDYIIHAASQASPKYYGSDPVGTLSANVLGTYNLLEFAREKQPHGFLYFSSGEVYGEVTEEQIPTEENMYGYMDPLNVRSCYGESKRMGETICISYMHQYGIPIKIVRPFHTYGPGMQLDDGRVFADFVSDVVNKKDIVMKSDGSAVRAFCYLADAVQGFFTVLLKGKVGAAYNIGSDSAISILELAHVLVNLFSERKLQVLQQERVQGGSYMESKITKNMPNISKMKRLGWIPRHSVQEGFLKTVRSFEI